MTQYENDDKYSKVVKETSGQNDLSADVSKHDRSIWEIVDIRTFSLMLIECVKYPFMYLCCNFIAFRGGMWLHDYSEAEQFYSRYGNIYYFFGNVLFLTIYYLIQSFSGSSRSRFCIFGDIRSLTKKGEKTIKSGLKRLSKKSKELFRKGITTKHVARQYFVHFFTGIIMGGLFLCVVVYLRRAGVVKSLQTMSMVRMDSNFLIGAVTFCFIVPLTEEMIYHAQDMIVLRRDFDLYRSSILVSVIYFLFNMKISLIVLYIPAIFMMNIVFDKTRNIRNSVLYTSGQHMTARVEKGNIISIKDRLRNGTRNDILNDTQSDVDDAKGYVDNDKKRLPFGRSVSAKSDITYSLLVNVGFHIALLCGLTVSFYRSELYEVLTRLDNVMLCTAIFLFVLHKFLFKRYFTEEI